MGCLGKRRNTNHYYTKSSAAPSSRYQPEGISQNSTQKINLDADRASIRSNKPAWSMRQKGDRKIWIRSDKNTPVEIPQPTSGKTQAEKEKHNIQWTKVKKGDRIVWKKTENGGSPPANSGTSRDTGSTRETGKKRLATAQKGDRRIWKQCTGKACTKSGRMSGTKNRKKARKVVKEQKAKSNQLPEFVDQTKSYGGNVSATNKASTIGFNVDIPSTTQTFPPIGFGSISTNMEAPAPFAIPEDQVPRMTSTVPPAPPLMHFATSRATEMTRQTAPPPPTPAPMPQGISAMRQHSATKTPPKPAQPAGEHTSLLSKALEKRRILLESSSDSSASEAEQKPTAQKTMVKPQPPPAPPLPRWSPGPGPPRPPPPPPPLPPEFRPRKEGSIVVMPNPSLPLKIEKKPQGRNAMYAELQDAIGARKDNPNVHVAPLDRLLEDRTPSEKARLPTVYGGMLAAMDKMQLSESVSRNDSVSTWSEDDR